MPGDVLIVDDNDAVREALCDCLSFLGYSVLAARDGEEAWIRLQQGHIAAVVLDNALAGDPLTDESGLALAKRVKGAFPSTPIIMLSAMPPEGASKVCEVVLCKPVPPRILDQSLRQIGVLVR